MRSQCQERLNNILNGFRECQDMFLAIGDETRLLIIFALIRGDLRGMRVGEIANAVHLTRPSVSHHLQILLSAGVVRVRKEKTMNFYSMNPEETNWLKMKMFVDEICDGMQHQCNRMKQEEKIGT